MKLFLAEIGAYHAPPPRRLKPDPRRSLAFHLDNVLRPAELALDRCAFRKT